MTWVVATVTSILYPAITKYEERLKNNTYPVSDDSVLSSDSSSFVAHAVKSLLMEATLLQQLNHLRESPVHLQSTYQ